MREKGAKKNSLDPHRQVAWVIPPENDGEYVARMEDVLEVYERSYDRAAPVVCMDEKSVQLLKETRPSMTAAPGRSKRIDYEYERNGTANIFMFCEPLAGWRQTRVTERRTKIDWAYAVRDLLDGRCAEAKVVVLVMDNLNTHSIGSLYEAFPPAETRRLAQRLEIHHMPKRGSWLNIAENELSALTRPCTPYWNDRAHDSGARGLGSGPQSRRGTCQLAFQHRTSTHQTPSRLPTTSKLNDD